MKLPIEGRWLALIVVIASGFVGALILAARFVRLPATEPASTPARATTGRIGITRIEPRTDGGRFGDDALMDPDPLFLPTPFNASQPELPPFIRREPGTVSQPIGPAYAFAYEQTAISFPEVVTVPARPVDSLTYGQAQNSYDVFGRFSREEPPLPPRVAVIEVVEAKTGKVVLSSEIASLAMPLPALSSDWRPLELLAAVNETGLVGLPDLASSSGEPAVDSFFRSYLAKQFHLGERLPSGFYALRIGP